MVYESGPMAQDVCVIVDAEDRARLAAVIGDRNRPHKHVLRARIVLWFVSQMYARSVRQIGLLASSNRQRPAVFDAPQGLLPQCLRADCHAGMSGALVV